MRHKHKFWVENISELFNSLDIIPIENMTFNEKLNSISRLFIIISISMFLLNFKNSSKFLIFSLLFIIIIYYIKKNKMETYKENYNPKTSLKPNMFKPLSDQARLFCNDEKLLSPNYPSANNLISKNQRLAGPPNPKTKIQPVIVPPSHDLEYWKANNLITHSHINTETEEDIYQSGYYVSTNCENNIENYNYKPTPKYGENGWHPQQENFKESSNGGYTQKEIFTYKYPYNKTKKVSFQDININNSDQVNTSCGYNPRQIKNSNLPSNFPAGNCHQDPSLAQYNKNLFTQIIEPGIYTNNQINEPINSNIGISFNQQLEPTTVETNEHGINYSLHDSRIIEPKIENYKTSITESNIYDPRFTGYGTSYRSYIDKQTGQPRFMYDDINSIRMPNYITRSKIDFEPYADTYGPMKTDQSLGNEYNSNIRQLAQDSFLKNTLKQRADIQQSLLRKNNSENWQRRMYPIRTSNQRMLGGCASCK